MIIWPRASIAAGVYAAQRQYLASWATPDLQRGGRCQDCTHGGELSGCDVNIDLLLWFHADSHQKQTMLQTRCLHSKLATSMCGLVLAQTSPWGPASISSSRCSSLNHVVAGFEDDIPFPITRNGIVVSSPLHGLPCAVRALKKLEVFLCKAVLSAAGVHDQPNALVWLAERSLPLSAVLRGDTNVPDPTSPEYVKALCAAKKARAERRRLVFVQQEIARSLYPDCSTLIQQIEAQQEAEEPTELPNKGCIKAQKPDPTFIQESNTADPAFLKAVKSSAAMQKHVRRIRRAVAPHHHKPARAFRF